MAIVAPEALHVGTRVAYEDAANPRREGRIVEVIQPNGTTPSGFALPTGDEYRVRWDWDETFPHPSRVTASGPDHVTGLLPRCPECPLAEGHEGDHLEADETVSDLRQRGWWQIADLPGNPFDGADIIVAYTREQAHEDGELVALDSIAAEAGFTVPVSLTRPLWNYVEATKEEEARMQSTNGRLWDVLSMARFGIAARKNTPKADEDRFDYRVLFYNLGRGRAEAGRKTKRLRLHIGPGDQAEPVITIGFPEDF